MCLSYRRLSGRGAFLVFGDACGLDVGGNRHRVDGLERKPPLLAPCEELSHSLGVCGSGVPVPNVRRKEFEEPTGGVLHLVGDFGRGSGQVRGGHDDHESGQGEPHARPDQPDPTRGDQYLLRGLGHFRGEMVPYAMTEEESRNRELLGCPPRHDPCAEQLCQLGGRHGHQGQRQDVKPVTAGMGRYVEHRASQWQRDHGDLEQRRYCDRPEQGEVGERSQPPERFGLTTASEGEEQLRERQCAECGGTCATEVFTLAEGIGEGYNPHGCHQNAMEKDPQPTAVGDHRLMRRARPAAHNVAFERLNT